MFSLAITTRFEMAYSSLDRRSSSAPSKSLAISSEGNWDILTFCREKKIKSRSHERVQRVESNER